MGKFSDIVKARLAKLAVGWGAARREVANGGEKAAALNRAREAERNPDMDEHGYYKPPPVLHSFYDEQQQQRQSWLRSGGAWERLYGGGR